MRKEVFIIGGGSSLIGFDFEKLRCKDTIVINQSVFDVPEPSYFITMDYSFLSKISIERFKSINTNKVFIVNLVKKYCLEFEEGRIVDKKYGIVYEKLGLFNVLIHSKKETGFSFNWFGFVNGKNSGFCALQLAVLLGYKEIYLLGIDLNFQTSIHYHSQYNTNTSVFENKLLEYFEFFKVGLNLIKPSGIKVYSCSLNSRLNELIPYKRMGEI